MFLVNSRQGLFAATPSGSRSESLHPNGAHLLPKLRCQFAEFLDRGSLKRLRILSPPTCVGLRYGHQDGSLEAFLGSVGSATLWPCGLVITSRGYEASDLPEASPYRLEPPIPAGGWPTLLRPPIAQTPPGGTGILTRFPSPTPFGLGLGAD